MMRYVVAATVVCCVILSLRPDPPPAMGQALSADAPALSAYWSDRLQAVETSIQVETDRLEYRMQLDLISYRGCGDEHAHSTERLRHALRKQIHSQIKDAPASQYRAVHDRVEHIIGFFDYKFSRIDNMAKLAARLCDCMRPDPEIMIPAKHSGVSRNSTALNFVANVLAVVFVWYVLLLVAVVCKGAYDMAVAAVSVCKRAFDSLRTAFASPNASASFTVVVTSASGTVTLQTTIVSAPRVRQ